MSFSDHADRLDEAVMTHLADTDSAIYPPFGGGDPLTISVMVDRDVERTVGGQPSATMERRTELTGYSSDLGDAKRGSTVAVGDDVWSLDRKDRDDGHLVTWLVTPAGP